MGCNLSQARCALLYVATIHSHQHCVMVQDVRSFGWLCNFIAAPLRKTQITAWKLC